MSISPDQINNFSKDFLFQQELYVGLGDQQFNVRARFANNEAEMATLKAQQEIVGNYGTRIGTLETDQGKIKATQSGLVESVAGSITRRAATTPFGPVSTVSVSFMSAIKVRLRGVTGAIIGGRPTASRSVKAIFTIFATVPTKPIRRCT